MPVSPTGYDTGGSGGMTPVARAAAETWNGKSLFEGSANLMCPIGSSLVVNAQGELVCRDRATGDEFRATKRTDQLKTAAQQANASYAAARGAGGGGGGGTGTGGTARTAGSTTTQSGSEYLTPGADIFAERPQALLADIIERTHGNDNRGFGLYGMLEPYADAANVLFLALAGQDAEGGTKEDFLSWLEDDFWGALMTPGGGLNLNQAVQNILNPAQNSPLASYLAVQDPGQQAQNFINLAAGIYGVGYHPLFANAMLDRLYYGRDEFLGEAARQDIAGMDPFYDWIQTSMPYIGTRSF